MGLGGNFSPLENHATSPEKHKFWAKKITKPLQPFFSDPKMAISVQFGIGDTVRIGREIQCLLYAGFFFIYQ